jgi:drug/metabolite transporter (DMT)-like permease
VLLSLGQLPPFVAWALTEPVWIASTDYVLPGVASVLLNLLANVLYLHAVKVSPLSLTVPLLSFVPVFAVAAADPLLGQLPDAPQLVGIGFVVLGALALNAGNAADRTPLGLVRALLRERGSLPMLGTAVCWSLTIVADKLATDHASYGAHGVVLNVGIGAMGIAWLAARRDLGKLAAVRHAWKLWVLAIGFATLGLGSQLLAIQHALVALVEALKRAAGLVGSVAVGRLIFAEPVTAAKIVAVVLMAVGTTAIVVR